MAFQAQTLLIDYPQVNSRFGACEVNMVRDNVY